jgi:hypothetical protein
MRERVKKRSAMGAELRPALAEQELFVVYQAVVGLRPMAASTAALGWKPCCAGAIPSEASCRRSNSSALPRNAG